ncbi:MAG: sigma-70 family RNA polymerase sigma factor [Oscillospiraceae bacterium]|nr:sigma-70 family RNA polymerase sigma factor [Oscillospiraceae bacterium]
MKSIYMVKKDPSKENEPGNWRMMARNEFLEFISTPEGRMRANSFGRLSSCGQNDPVIIAECGSAEAKKWKDEQNRHRYLREIEKEVAPFGLLSLNQSLDDDLTLEETLCDESVDAEAEAIGEIRKEELKEALDRLDPMEKSLIQMTVLAKRPISLSEFGDRYMLDRTYLQRKKHSALRKLRVIIRMENRDEKKDMS